METTGIICEYNPLHLGHKKQLDAIRAKKGECAGIVCLMSGNFVQRGAPAIFDKSLRAKAAVLSGADLVLELPVTVSLSSAEGFAAGGVSILGGFCDTLCFGAETAEETRLTQTAQALLSPDFSPALRAELEKGLSFPAARQAALEAMGVDAGLLSRPNDILAVEYCKAILSQGLSMRPMPIHRGGSYHDTQADRNDPSATALRALIRDGGDWLSLVPEDTRECFRDAAAHTLEFGHRALLTRLRTMRDEDFEALPYGSEGLWRKFMHAAREKATLEEILTEVKSKRYTRSRLDRMLMCAFLELTEKDLATPAPYIRVLAFNDRGREILKKARQSGQFRNAGEDACHPWQDLEYRCGDLYGLFAKDPEAPGTEKRRRVFYRK